MASERTNELGRAYVQRLEVERDGLEVQLRWALEEAALWKSRCYDAWLRESKLADEIVRLSSGERKPCG